MKPSDLEAWQKLMGYSQTQAAKELGIARATYRDMLSGVYRNSGRPAGIDRRTALACNALAHGIGEYSDER